MLFQLSALAFILCIHCENIQGDQLKNSSSNSSSHGAQPDHPPKNVASDDHTATKRPIDEQIDLKRATSHRHLVVEHDDFTAYIVEADYTENPVNGQWSRWTDSDCLGSCGVGNRLRIRTCTEPPPQYGGAQCEGPAMQTVACMVDNCSVNEGIWSPWMVGPCSASCGNGTTIMTRTCNGITPGSVRNACTGADEELVLCKEMDCADRVYSLELCLPGFVHKGDKCLKFIQEGASWADAAFYCNTIGANLVMVNSSKEQSWLVEFMVNYVGLLPSKKCIWGDGNDLAQDNRWVWSKTGEEFSYQNWHPGEPNSGTSASCLFIYQPEGYIWYDDTCSSLCAPVCEAMPFQVNGPIVGR